MVEIIFLISSTCGIAAYARGRGGNPLLWGAISVTGYLLILFAGGLVIGILRVPAESDARLLPLGASLAWVGIIAFCARFLLGAGRKKPSGMWACPNCKYLNRHYAVICEACKHAYGQPTQHS
jgi:hypothetical protein